MSFEVRIPVLYGLGKGGPAAKDTGAGIGAQQAADEIAFSEQDRFVLFCSWRQIVGVVIDPNNRGFIHFHLHMIIRFNQYGQVYYQPAGANSHAPRMRLKKSCQAIQSARKLFTGLAMAALIAWQLTVSSDMMTANTPASRKTHHCISMRYS